MPALMHYDLHIRKGLIDILEKIDEFVELCNKKEYEDFEIDKFDILETLIEWAETQDKNKC